MNNSPLYYQMLEPALIIKGFVKQDNDCNYEKYLLEMVNASLWFQNRFSSSFLLAEDQSRGQCDAYSDSYGLDFKLIASKTKLQAKSVLSPQIEKKDDGECDYCAPRKQGHILSTRFPQAFRGKTIEELLNIRNNASKKQGVDNDIRDYMNTLDTKKNLLVLFPYRFRFNIPSTFMDDISSIISQCNKDFGVSLKYREEQHPQLDTFFSFFYDYSFILCRWEHNHLVFLEEIPVEKSEIFMHLALTYCEDWKEKYDVVLQLLKEGKSDKEIEKTLSEGEL